MLKKQARKDVPSFIVVVTDGESNDPKLTIKEAKVNNKAGITTYAVGVGSNLNNAELKAIAGSEKRLIVKSSFQSLINGFADIAADACKGKKMSSSFTD